MKCGSGVKLRKDIFYGNPKNVQIGDKSSINRGAFLDCYDKIIIGNNVGIAFQATLITSTHEIGGEKNRAGELVGKPIVIEDGVWVGARAIIGPGVKIGSGSLISAGAALMRSVPANSVVAGVPGRLITRLASKPATDVAAVSEGTIQGVDRSKGCLRWTPSLGQPASRVKL
jgi:acetyltransferase-like isoleucine patch superfamily enzyme